MITTEQRKEIIAALRREIARLEAGEEPGCITALWPIDGPGLWLETPPDDSDLVEACLDEFECEWHEDVESSEWGLYVRVRRAAAIEYHPTCWCSRHDYEATFGYVGDGYAESDPPERVTCEDCEAAAIRREVE